MNITIETFTQTILAACNVACGGRLLTVVAHKAIDENGDEHEVKGFYQWKLHEHASLIPSASGFISENGRATKYCFKTNRQIPLYFGGKHDSIQEDSYKAFYWANAVDRSDVDPKMRTNFEQAYKEVSTSK